MNPPAELAIAVEQIQKRARKLHIPISEAVDEVLPGLTLPSDVGEYFLRYGIVAYLNDAEHKTRIDIVRNGLSVVGRQTKKAYVNLEIVYGGADTRPRKLIDFSIDDWGAFEQEAQAQAKAWMERVALAKKAKFYLASEGVSCTRDLSAEALGELSDMVGEAW